VLKMKQAAEHVLMLAAEKGLKDVDVVVERNDSLDIEIRDAKVEKVEQSTSLGLGVRVLDEGRTGLASTERLSQESIHMLFKMRVKTQNCKIQLKLKCWTPQRKSRTLPRWNFTITNLINLMRMI